MNDYAVHLKLILLINYTCQNKTKPYPAYKKESKSFEILKRACITSSSYRLKMKFLVKQFGILEKPQALSSYSSSAIHWLSKHGQDL